MSRSKRSYMLELHPNMVSMQMHPMSRRKCFQTATILFPKGLQLSIQYYGQQHKVPILNLRLYSVYGPYEDPSRLIPSLVREARNKSLPAFADANISRDYIFIDDVCRAYYKSALGLANGQFYGESFNIGTGKNTTLAELASIAQREFNVKAKPKFGSYPKRSWDVENWHANTEKAQNSLSFEASTTLEEGLQLTARWQTTLDDEERYWLSSKKTNPHVRRSIAAIIAVYMDEPAVPIMYERLHTTFRNLNVDYKIIFVNDRSPDNAEEAIRIISQNDPNVLGITHSRNFGSQMAFMSGMTEVNTDAVVLLDGDLRPP